jgi:hypothetical protein
MVVKMDDTNSKAEHLNGFFFPHVHDLRGDDFAGLRSETNGRAYFQGTVFRLRHNQVSVCPTNQSECQFNKKQAPEKQCDVPDKQDSLDLLGIRNLTE